MSQRMNTAVSRAFGLVEILVVCAILAVLAAVILPHYLGNSRTPAGKAATPLAKAHDTECMMNLRSVRQFIEVYKTTGNEGNPKSLSEIQGMTPDLMKCPVGNVPYVYDPATGEVHCPFPSHEQF